MAFLRRLTTSDPVEELAQDAEAWDDGRERDEFGLLVDSTPAPSGPSVTSGAADTTDTHLDPWTGETDGLFEDDGALHYGDDTWHNLSVTTLTPETVRLFVEHDGPLCLHCLRDITPEAAEAFVNHKWVALDGLTTLCDDAAEVLAGFQGTGLFLRGLRTLSDKAAAALGSNPRIVLPEKFMKAPE
jgi:hypothetical protein